MEHEMGYMISHYGYWGIIALFVGGMIGLPIPDEVILVFVGYQIHRGNMFFLYAYISAVFGTFIGISISYWIGRLLGMSFLQKIGPKVGLNEKRIEKAHTYFNRWGPVVLFVGYFIPGVRYITAYLAGISKMDGKKFIVYAYSGAMCWVLVFLLIGRELGRGWEQISGYIHYPLIIFLALLSVGIGLFWYYKQQKRVYK